MRNFLIAAAVASLPLAAIAQDLPEDQIKQLALEAILENPEIIMEAVAILEQQRNEAEALANAQALHEQRDFLLNDPNAPF